MACSANSMALVADAGHNIGDVLGLVMAWVAMVLARRAPSRTHTYGLRRGTILASLANAVLLLVTVRRNCGRGPAPLVGTVRSRRRHRHGGGCGWHCRQWRPRLGCSLPAARATSNLRSAFMHMAADALVSLGVVVVGGVVLFTGWTRLDPLASLAISAVLLTGTWGLLRDSVDMALDAVPSGIKPDAVRAFLTQQPGVTAIHDLHIWPMSTTETALTCHCVIPGRPSR